MMQFPFSFWKLGLALPGQPADLTITIFLSTDASGYPQDGDFHATEWYLYSHNAGGYSSPEVDSAQYYFSELANGMDVPYGAVFDESGGFFGSQSFQYTIQTKQQDSLSTIGYSEQNFQGQEVMAFIPDYGLFETGTGSEYSGSEYVEYNITANWSGGSEWFGDSMSFMDITVSGVTDLQIVYSGAYGFNGAPGRVYVERRINGGSWEHCFDTWTGTFTDDGSHTWTSGVHPDALTNIVPWFDGMYMFGASGFTTLGYRIEKYNNNTAVTKHGDFSNLLGSGWITFDETDWTAGAATFNGSTRFWYKLDWTAGVDATGYRVLGRYENGNFGVIRNYDYYMDTASLTVTDKNTTGWTAV